MVLTIFDGNFVLDIVVFFENHSKWLTMMPFTLIFRLALPFRHQTYCFDQHVWILLIRFIQHIARKSARSNLSWERGSVHIWVKWFSNCSFRGWKLCGFLMSHSQLNRGRERKLESFLLTNRLEICVIGKLEPQDKSTDFHFLQQLLSLIHFSEVSLVGFANINRQ